MYLNHLSITNFRNFARLDIDIPRRVILLVGDNAQGKTSLLEAVYFLAACTSFQTNVDRQVVNFLEAKGDSLAVARLVAEFQKGNSRHRLEVRLILEPIGSNGKRLRKEVLVDGVKKPVNEAIGLFNAVVFVPQMSQIIEGRPEERRRYLDLALAQVIPAYTRTLSEYGQALSQRNALLKLLNERGGDVDQLFVWDETLSRLGSEIILWRIRAVQELERFAGRTHHRLTNGSEILRLAYQPSYDPLPKPEGQIPMELDTPVDRSNLKLEEIQIGFTERLNQLRQEEIARGVTTIGPQRDEIRLLANGLDLGDYGSRGQIRTALLSLKLAEVEWMKERTGHWPVILFDEVMAELDLQRRSDLLAYLEESEQVLLTATDVNMFAPGFIEQAAVWDVQAGTVKNRSPEA
ncbi:MAG: DNA replication/repair protein RecF [Anaerolineales bacterium]|nr:DNA replication/repair protein RecF [Anaerolineales bacterium]